MNQDQLNLPTGKDLHFFLEIGDYRLAYQFGEFNVRDLLDGRESSVTMEEAEAMLTLHDFLELESAGEYFKKHFPFFADDMT